MADLEHDVPITPDTIFEAGSVSKQFTAASVLLLAREQKLSLDDLARTYIPELPPYSPDITIRHMLNHPAACATGAASPALPGGRGQRGCIRTPTCWKLSTLSSRCIHAG